MRALQCVELGQPLVVNDIPTPEMKPGHVRIGVHACGVNFADSLMISGKYQEKPPLPFMIGMECAGEVLEVADDVTTLKPGDRVMALPPGGSSAEECVCPADHAYPIPDSMSFEQAAAFPVVYGTSHVGLSYRAKLEAGETLLVHAAAGGVGLAAVEIGKAMGATVIGTAGGAEKCAIATAHGADHVIDYRSEDIKERVRELTGGGGANVVYDPVGGDVFDASLRCIAWEGRLLIIGFAAGRIQEIPANLLLIKNCSAVGFYWGAYRKHNPGLFVQSFTELFRMFEAGKLDPHVSGSFDLAQAEDAIGMVTGRKSTGKVLLTTGR